jgi:hypothetical protein
MNMSERWQKLFKALGGVRFGGLFTIVCTFDKPEKPIFTK